MVINRNGVEGAIMTPVATAQTKNTFQSGPPPRHARISVAKKSAANLTPRKAQAAARAAHRLHVSSNAKLMRHLAFQM